MINFLKIYERYFECIISNLKYEINLFLIIDHFF